jgi:hypothetical protein
MALAKLLPSPFYLPCERTNGERFLVSSAYRLRQSRQGPTNQ